jgi:hypothetical protein
VGVSQSAPRRHCRKAGRTGGTLRIATSATCPADGHWINGQNVIYPVYDGWSISTHRCSRIGARRKLRRKCGFTQITFKVRKGVTFHSGRS